jgi:hypothetical protein
VEKALAKRMPAIRNQAATIHDDVDQALQKRPIDPWSEPIRRKARRIARSPVEPQDLGVPDTS